MKKTKEETEAFMQGIIFGMLVTFAGIMILLNLIIPTRNTFYRQGQIDALTGKIHVQVDTTKEWIYKP